MTEMIDVVLNAIDSTKAENVVSLDVRHLTALTDYMVIATGDNSRHMRAIINKVIITLKENGIIPLSLEGEQTGEWILLDIGDVVLHVMLQSTRDFYALEKLWGMHPTASAA